MGVDTYPPSVHNSPPCSVRWTLISREGGEEGRKKPVGLRERLLFKVLCR